MFQALRKAVSGNHTKDPRNSLVQDEYRKKTLKENLALSIKNLQKAHINGVVVVERNDEDAENICQALEAIFLHEYQMQARIIPNNINFNLKVILTEGIKPDDSVISISFWDVLKEVTHNDVIAELKHLVVTTEVGLCRSWIRLAINDCLFLSYLDAILSNTSLVKRYYGVNAFLMDSELPFLLKELLQGLLQFEFRLNYNSSKLNTWDSKTLQLAGIVKHKGKTTPENVYIHNPHGNMKVSSITIDSKIDAVKNNHSRKIDAVRNNHSRMLISTQERDLVIASLSCKNESHQRTSSTSKDINNPRCSRWKDGDLVTPFSPKDNVMRAPSILKQEDDSGVESKKCNFVRNEKLQQNEDALIPSIQGVIPSKLDKTDKDDRNVEKTGLKPTVHNKDHQSELMLQLNGNTSCQDISNLPRSSPVLSKKLTSCKKGGDKISASPQNCGDGYPSALVTDTNEQENIQAEYCGDNTDTNEQENMQAEHCGDNTLKDNMIRNVSPPKIENNNSLSREKIEDKSRSMCLDKCVNNGSKVIVKDDSMLSNTQPVGLDKVEDICVNNGTVSGCIEEISVSNNQYPHHSPQYISEVENSDVEQLLNNISTLNNKLDECKGLSISQNNELYTKCGSNLLPQSGSTVCDAADAEILVFEEGSNRIIDCNVSAANIENVEILRENSGVEGDGLILNGNRLNGMGWSGWSSSFDNRNDVEDLSDDSVSPDSECNNEQLNESFGSLLQIYGNSPNYVHTEYLKTQGDMSKAKDEVQVDAVLDERVICSAHNDAQLVQLNFEVVHLDAPLQGQNIDKKALSSINQLTHIASEVGLDKQAFCCQHCGVLIGLIYGPYRVCRYDGHYYCYDCHDDEEHIIPARVIQEWDFRKYAVSKYNKLFLMKIEEEPLFHMDEINLLLYGVVSELCEMKNLRMQLQHIKEYVQTCRHEVAEDFRRRLWPREYLCDDVHQYSLLDLVQVYNGQQAHHLKKIIAQFSKHIFKCTLCCQKGFICEYCHDSTIIYPFQVDIAVQCPGCLATFHKVCRQDKRCPKCVRVHLRSQSVGKQENDGRLIYVNQKDPCSNSDIL